MSEQDGMAKIARQLDLSGAAPIPIDTAFENDLLALMRRHNIPLIAMCVVQRVDGGLQIKAIAEHDGNNAILQQWSQMGFNQGFLRPMMRKFRHFLDTGKFEGDV